MPDPIDERQPAVEGRCAAAFEQRVPRYTSYPTAPHFHPGIGREAYGRWLAALGPDRPVSVYVHVPFCDSLCWFCGCHTKIVRRYEPVAAYLETLLQEAELVSSAIGSPVEVSHIHWGGGTPTILAAGDVLRLADKLRERFDVLDTAEFAVEIDPRELPRETIVALGRAGVNRASLGVQDVNPDVQRAVNRLQPIDVTRRAVEELRAVGVRGINIDLMYGLPHQTERHIQATIDAVLTLAPDRLSLFGYAHLPGFKTHQRMIEAAALPNGRQRWRQFISAAERLQAEGYVWIGLDHFALPGDPLAAAQAAGQLRRNFQGYTTDRADALIGLGASAIGEFPQGYVQNAVPIHAYRDSIARGQLPTARGFAISDEDRLRRHVIERLMCDLSVDVSEASRLFGRPADHFAPELSALGELETAGMVEVDGSTVRIPRDARPLMRVPAAVFDAYLQRTGASHAQAV